ncbi:hypothetical protein SprV_0702416000 [Sparganum proliferum]
MDRVQDAGEENQPPPHKPPSGNIEAQDMSCGEDDVSDSAVASEDTLAPREDSVFMMVGETAAVDASEDFPCGFNRRDASVLTTELPDPSPFVEIGACGVLDILGKLSCVSQHLK